MFLGSIQKMQFVMRKSSSCQLQQIVLKLKPLARVCLRLPRHMLRRHNSREEDQADAWENVGTMNDDQVMNFPDEDEEDMRSLATSLTMQTARAQLGMMQPSQELIPAAQVEALALQLAQRLLQESNPQAQAARGSEQPAPGRGYPLAPPQGNRKKTTSAAVQKNKALTGSEAPFPTLSREFSMDITFNILGSLKSKMVTFKWKLLLLLMRTKRAVEMDRTLKWKRNPRWIMALHGRQLAALWGHLGSARQLCFNPKVFWLADLDRPDNDQVRTSRRSQ